MAQAYTPGLLVTPRTVWRSRRVLPLAGDVRVTLGQTVDARDIVAETLLPGNATPVNLAKSLSISPSQLATSMICEPGKQVRAGEVIAKSPGLFGFFGSEYKSPVTATLESVSHITGQAILRGDPLRVQVQAYLTGRVVELLPNEGVVIEAEVALVQGIFGIGGEAYGPLACVCEDPKRDLTDDLLTPAHAGAIVVGGRRVTQAAVRKAQSLGVAALISGGIDDQDLREILGYDLGVAVTGMEKLGLTVIITEGFGDIAMARRTFELLRQHVGAPTAVNGTTQIRAGVLRPEILIPLTKAAANGHAATPTPESLEIGAPVRLIREPYFGELGKIESLPPEPHVLESESKARVVRVRLARGDTVVVPRANVEILEGTPHA